MGRIYDYKVNYSHYLELRKERRVQQQKAYDEQQKMIAETKDFIERFKGTYSKNTSSSIEGEDARKARIS
jgi:ATP-binding cassette subfamily F protein 3